MTYIKGLLRDRQNWAANTLYLAGDLVTYADIVYVCEVAHTSGTAFSGTNWSQRGTQAGAYLVPNANTPVSSLTLGNESTLYSGAGFPTLAANFGDYYFRQDTPTIATCIWTGPANLLTPNDSSFEGNIGGWVDAYAATLSVSTLAALDGASALRIGNAGPAVSTIVGDSGRYAVQAGSSYVYMAAFRPIGALRSPEARVEWEDGVGTSLGLDALASSNPLLETPGAFTFSIGVAVAPPGAANARFQADIGDFGSGGQTTGTLGAPAAPTVTPEGTAGTTSYSYEVTYTNQYGETLPSAVASTTTGNATLDSTNYNQVAWAMPAQNLQPDSSFEGGAAGWNLTSTASVSTSKAHSGTQSLYVDGSTGLQVEYGPTIKIMAGAPIVVSGYVWIVPGSAATPALDVINFAAPDNNTDIRVQADIAKAGTWQRVSAVGTIGGSPQVRTFNDIGDSQWYLDDVQLETPINLLTPAQSSFEDGSTGGWSIQGAGSTHSNTTAQAYDGTHSLEIVADGTSSYQGVQVAIPGEPVGTEITFSVAVLFPAGATGRLVGSYAGGSPSITTFTGTGAWQMVSVTGASQSASSQAVIVDTGATPQAITFYIDSADVFVGPYPTGPSPYQEIAANVYRTAGGATQGKIATSYGTSLNDTGLAAAGAAPTVDTTGEAHLIDCVGIFPGDTLGYQLEVLSDGPVAYFPLDDPAGATTVRNAVGSGDGTVHGGVTFGEPGPIASDATQTAALFDGNTGYIEQANSPVSLLPEFTVEMLLNPASSTNGFSCILCTRTQEGAHGWEIDWGYPGAGEISITMDGQTLIPYALPEGYSHVAFTYDGTTVKLVVGGVEVGSIAGTLLIPTISDFLISGRYSDSATPGNFFYGGLSHVAVYPTALSAARIAAHYNAAKNTTGNIVQRWTSMQSTWNRLV